MHEHIRDQRPRLQRAHRAHARACRRTAYFDPRHYERELQRIWYRNWIYVGRSSEVAAPRAFRTFELGDQKLLLVRDESGALQGFHNTCRHRGAALCREERGNAALRRDHLPVSRLDLQLAGRAAAHLLQGRTPPASTWRIIRSTRSRCTNGTDSSSSRLTEHPPAFDRIFDVPLEPARRLAARANSSSGMCFVKTIQSNWKIFWENYNECLHCPGVHPKLSSLVPIYGRGHAGGTRRSALERGMPPRRDPKYKGGMRAGAATWSLDGQLSAAPFPGISEEDRKVGSRLHDRPAVGVHRRPRRLRARGAPAAAGAGADRTAGRISVLAADPGGSEVRLAQHRGVHQLGHDRGCGGVRTESTGPARGAPHARGVVMPEEYVIRQFHEWIESELARV